MKRDFALGSAHGIVLSMQREAVRGESKQSIA
jgi:hypothetical protein